MTDTPEQRLEAALEYILKLHIGAAYLYSTDDTPAAVPQDSVRDAKAAILAAVTAELRAIVPEKPNKVVIPDMPGFPYGFMQGYGSGEAAGYGAAIDTILSNAKARGINLE
jgi:hypothetical protein